MATVTNNGVTIHYTVDGPPDGPVVVLLEGLGYGRWMWKWTTEVLSNRYTVVRPDNRGTGKSDAPPGPYSIAEMASDVDAVLEDQGVEAAHVVGASMGGMIALQYALDFERAETLGLLCTGPGGDEAEPTPDSVLDHMFSVPESADERETIRHRMQPAVTDGFFQENPKLVERIVDWRLRNDANDEAREAQAAAVGAFDVSGSLSQISMPTLILHGTADKVVPISNGELLAEKLPNATFERVQGGSHLFFIERRGEINERLRAFLESNG